MTEELTITEAYSVWREEQIDAHVANEAAIRHALTLLYEAKSLVIDTPNADNADIADAISAAIDAIVGDTPDGAPR